MTILAAGYWAKMYAYCALMETATTIMFDLHTLYEVHSKYMT